MRKDIINRLTILSYKGYQKTIFVESEDIYAVKIDCANIKTEQQFYDIFEKYFDFPTPVKNWDAFSDWMRDLAFWDKDKAIRIELINFDQCFNNDYAQQFLMSSVFFDSILPYWEEEVVRVTSGDMHPRQFDVYCVMARRLELEEFLKMSLNR